MAAVFPTSFPASGSPSSTSDEVAKLRVPPHSIEAEQSVLGGLLLDNSAWDRASDILHDSDFYRLEHQLIFVAVQKLVNASKPADVITVYEQLQMMGKGDDVGGLAYLNALAQSVPSAANIRRYAEIVRERAVLRKLVSASDEIATNAFNPQGRTVSDILDEAEAKIMKIGEEGSRNKQGFFSMDGLVVDLLDRVTELADNGAEDVTGVRTGFIDMDKMTAGLQKGDLIILAARPSMGKTAFALNIGENVAVNEGLPVAVFSMEMGASQLAVVDAASGADDVDRLVQPALRQAWQTFIRKHRAEEDARTAKSRRLQLLHRFSNMARENRPVRIGAPQAVGRGNQPHIRPAPANRRLARRQLADRHRVAVIGRIRGDDPGFPSGSLRHAQGNVIRLRPGAGHNRLRDAMREGGRQAFNVIQDAVMQIAGMGVQLPNLRADRLHHAGVAMADMGHVVVAIQIAIARRIPQPDALTLHNVNGRLIKRRHIRTH